MSLSSAQCRAARALIDWTQAKLAEAADTGVAAVVDFERGTGQARPALLRQLRQALETGGVEFTDGDRPGVSLKRPGPADEGMRPDQLNSENDG